MNTLTAGPERDHDQDGDDDLPREQLPGRPRRRLLTKLTVPLLGLVLIALGFLGGVEVQRHHGGSPAGAGLVALGSTSGSGLSANFAGGSSGRPSFNPGASRAAGARSSSGGGSGGPPSGFAGGPGGAGGGTTGTVSSISRRTIDLKTTSGNTIQVTVTRATSLKKEEGVTRNAIRPGDTITVDGITGARGSIRASSVSDTGSSSSSGSASSSSSG
jgi:hypothetical protein